MKKIFLLLLFISTIAQAQIVNIPDANFKARLLSADVNIPIAKDVNGNNIKIDINSDGEIQLSETNQVFYLEVSFSSITDMSGIENFTNLTSLICYGNNISVLNINNLLNLINLNCGDNNLTVLNVSNNSSITTLLCRNNMLANLDVDNNLNLTKLDCSYNNLSSLNVNTNLNLLELDYDGNNITTINLNSNLLLTRLSCSYNDINSLNVSNNINLVNLSCTDNNLNSLDLSNNINIESLVCYNNNLTSLNLNNNLYLSILRCEYNNLNSLDVSSNPNLTKLWCVDNNLTTLDVSNNHFLNSLDVRNNNLITLFMKNGVNEPTSLDNNPNLIYICLDEGQVTLIQNQLNTLGMASTVCNSYCSFTPGGDYSTIEGIVQYDFNEDGCNVLDSPASYTRIDVNLDGITTNSSVFSNEAGVYNLYTSTTGVFNLVPNTENPSFFNINPIAVDVPVMTIDNAVATQNFCVTANGVHPDLEIVIAPIIPARPGFAAEYKIVYRNKGNQMMSQLYGINFFYNQHLMTFVSATQTPSSIVSGGLSWDYANLMPFESRSINVVMQINAPTDTDPVNIGDVLQFTSSIMPMTGDESTVDNLFQFNQTVVGSFDPNDITCIEGEVVDPSYIGEYLHYVINFENTGTAPAENVVVKLEINPSDFDINSLRILESSHGSSIKITNNILEIIFQTIMLETGGHGNVLLKVRSKDNLTINDMVTNSAKIYFDYNFPILTNDANTVFQTLSNAIPVKDVLVKIYPNPTINFLNIETVSNLKSIELYDVNGRILEINKLNHNRAVFDFSKYKSGLYFVKITTEEGSKIEKIIKE